MLDRKDKTELDPRERAVFQFMVSTGSTDVTTVGTALNVAPKSVRNIVSDVTSRLAAHDKAGTVIKLLRSEQIQLPFGETPLSNQEAVERVRHSERLTRREKQVLEAMTQGGPTSNAAIADVLGLQPKTVRNHVSRIINKLGAEDKTQALMLAIMEGHIMGPTAGLKSTDSLTDRSKRLATINHL